MASCPACGSRSRGAFCSSCGTATVPSGHTRRGRLVVVAAAAVLAGVVGAVLAWSTTGSPGASRDRFGVASSPESPARLTVFLVDDDAHRVTPAVVDVPIHYPQGAQAALAAVRELIEGAAAPGHYTTWGPCSPADEVSGVTVDDDLVTVELAGQEELCALDHETSTLQEQQLAWTVVHNAGVADETPVRVLDPGGDVLWEVVTRDRYRAGPLDD